MRQQTGKIKNTAQIVVLIFREIGEIFMVRRSSKKDTTTLLRKLEDKKTRIDAFGELIEIGGSKTIKPLIEALKKMTWDEALFVASHLGEYGERIIPHLENILSPSEKPSVYTASIKALGTTKSEKAFNIIFPLLQKQEKWLLSNERTFGETIDALIMCGQKHLSEFMGLLDNSDWLIRSGAVYACGKIGGFARRNKKFIAKLTARLHSLMLRDRSEKVKGMAKLAIDHINGRDDIKDSFNENMEYIQQKSEEGDLHLKYRDKIEEIIDFLNYCDYSVSEREGYWEIISNEQENVMFTISKSKATGEEYFNMYTCLQELPKKNILPLYRQLLEWNQLDFSGTSKLFVVEDKIYIQDVKRLELIDPPEIIYSIQILLDISRKYSESMKNFY